MKSRIVFGVSLIFLFLGCTNPTTPEFDIKDGLMSVEAFVSNFQGSSYAKIYRLNEFNVGVNSYVNVFESNAEVTFINIDTNETISLEEDEVNERYLPPFDFVAAEGDTWQLNVKLEDGTEYISTPETMAELVGISDAKAVYESELEYVASKDKFAPGHTIFVDINDPPEKGNFYYWSYRTFEKKEICEMCFEAMNFRDGKCTLYTDPQRVDIPPYFTYYCESDCWQIRYDTRVNIFADDFVNGNSLQLPVATLLLYKKNKILVELQQYSISPAAYKYFAVLKDIVDDNNGLNAPPPAPLFGNIINPNDDQEVVLGRFTAAAGSEKRLLIERSAIKEDALEISPVPRKESSPIPEDQRVYVAPCGSESRYLTYIEPEGWN
ncbi:DUF4249 domain-containing protein [Maribacter litoralis]|uniref:DUF4249 domain-containing protein n=1 Tax=Maribacter litoralis TaxID=2059726 RepID=A0A653MD08_9FLAO|nr:DUF4249 domain-containing protein [Maribacter litoralis]VXB01810.1 conserved hypothetical protein [Maribacter litoralis]